MRPFVLVLVFAFVASNRSLEAHPGGLDQNGGHFNRKTGEYHSHHQTAAAAPPVLIVPRLSVPSPRLAPRTTPPRTSAWSESGDEDRVRVRIAAAKLKEAEADPDRFRSLLLEIVADFADTPSAPRARRLLEPRLGDDRPRVETNPAEQAEKHAASKLHFARQFIEQGKADAAKRTLTDLVRNYPETSSAIEAKKLLQAIP